MKSARRFSGRAAIQQRVLPAYRAGFFEAMARRCRGGLEVFAGEARPDESIRQAASLERARWRRARNLHWLRGGLYFCLQPGLVEWLEEVDPDALVLEANPRYPSSLAAIEWMRRRRRPVLGWGLGAPTTGLLAGWFRRRFLRRLDGVIAYSTRGAAEYARAGVAVDRIYVAPNAVDSPAARMPVRRPLTRRAPRLITAGRLQRRKRIDDLLRACAAASTPVELWIVGDGPDRPRLEAEASRHFPSAVFLGARYGEDLRRLLDRADLFVLAGTGGLALQQGLARGLPVIAARGDGSQEDMVTPWNGWLLAPDDPPELAAAVEEALLQRRRWPAMGRASLELARRRFNPHIMLDVFIQALLDAQEGR